MLMNDVVTKYDFINPSYINLGLKFTNWHIILTNLKLPL